MRCCCACVYAGGAGANLPSILHDNPTIAQQWKAFLLSLLMDVSTSSSTSSATGSSMGGGAPVKRGLTLQQATAAAVFLLLQDRLDDAEQVLAQHGVSLTGDDVCTGAGGQEAAAATAGEPAAGASALSMQRDYLAAWLALARPLTGSSTTATAAAGGGGVVGEPREVVAAQAIKLGRAVLNKYQGCAVGVSVSFSALAFTYRITYSISNR